MAALSRPSPDDLTDAERQTLHDTIEHITQVQYYLGVVSQLLYHRAMRHDQSKLEPPELSIFAQVNEQLAGLTYGSEEYHAVLEGPLADALAHHYAHNRHHPEHHEEGLAGMHLVDFVEMIVDWKAATLRHDDGDLHASIDHNQERFGYSDQVASMLHNTAELLAEWPPPGSARPAEKDKKDRKDTGRDEGAT